MALINKIKYDGLQGENSWLVYKYPSEDFVLGSQLIVNQGQEALFLKGGEACDVFSAGTHTLQTGNLPLLNKLVNLPFGGKTPFSAEIYYINKASKLDMKWGTSKPIPMEDAKYSTLLSVRAFGQLGVAIKDTRLFITRIVGAMNHGEWIDYILINKYFNGLINTKVKMIIANYMMKRGISFLEVTLYLEELSQHCQEILQEEFNRFGIEIVNFFVDSINIPEENTAQLVEIKNKRAELDILGEDYYRQRSFDVLDKLAEHANTSMVTEMGMGIGIAATTSHIFSDLAGQIQTMPTKPKQEGGVRCQKCNAFNSQEAKFCCECGIKLSTALYCTKCGTIVQSNMKFCGECGQAVVKTRCSGCDASYIPGKSFCSHCGTRYNV